MIFFLTWTNERVQTLWFYFLLFFFFQKQIRIFLVASNVQDYYHFFVVWSRLVLDVAFFVCVVTLDYLFSHLIWSRTAIMPECIVRGSISKFGFSLSGRG